MFTFTIPSRYLTLHLIVFYLSLHVSFDEVK